MMVSWYSSVLACLASRRTARGRTARAMTTATSSPVPSDSVTLHDIQSHQCTALIRCGEAHACKHHDWAARTQQLDEDLHSFLVQLLIIHHIQDGIATCSGRAYLL